MKTLALALLFSWNASAHNGLPDIPPDAGSREYRSLLQGRKGALSQDGLGPVIRAGERNLDWLEHINSFLPEGQKLSFTSKETQRGIPIDAPSEYSPAIILNDWAKLQTDYPPEMAAVVFQGEDFTDAPPVETAIYLEWSRKLDRLYQISARWRMMEPWLPSLGSRRRADIRGHYFLSRLTGREEKLRTYSSLAPEEQAKIREWLEGLCHNSVSSLTLCRSELATLINGRKDLNSYYQRYEAKSAALYRSFFTIPAYAARSDFRWDSSSQAVARLIAPFLDPGKPEVRHFVQFNVMEEWQWNGWRLELPLVSGGSHPYIVFVPGATPNVNGLGGSRITMDANQPLTEYDAQWTIRHEFGHVLGLPDCYVEFYVAERQVILNYQIDVDNIMCSRRGKVKQENVDELKRVYGR